MHSKIGASDVAPAANLQRPVLVVFLQSVAGSNPDVVANNIALVSRVSAMENARGALQSRIRSAAR